MVLAMSSNHFANRLLEMILTGAVYLGGPNEIPLGYGIRLCSMGRRKYRYMLHQEY